MANKNYYKTFIKYIFGIYNEANNQIVKKVTRRQVLE